jgi:oligopeptide/dipeptide ABC transporter ATP-binding protein
MASTIARMPDYGDAAPLPQTGNDELLRASDIQVLFQRRDSGLLDRSPKFIRAVDGVDVTIQRREVLSIVGESGSGKTTLGRAILGLQSITSGDITFDGVPVTTTSSAAMKRIRRRMQVIFQDPYASLHPRFTIEKILAEPLKIQGIGSERERKDRIFDLLAQVGLPSSAMLRFPNQFSGGQRQRIAIARALALNPDFIVADEPVSALDVSIQAQILNLLTKLRHERQLSMLVISHDLAVVRHVSDRVAVMYLGRIVETAASAALFKAPAHPYTIALMSAVPRIGSKSAKTQRIVLAGDPPSPMNPPKGCRFHNRCWLRDRLGRPPDCATIDPTLTAVGAGHVSACHFAAEAQAQWEQSKKPTTGNCHDHRQEQGCL